MRVWSSDRHSNLIYSDLHITIKMPVAFHFLTLNNANAMKQFKLPSFEKYSNGSSSIFYSRREHLKFSSGAVCCWKW